MADGSGRAHVGARISEKRLGGPAGSVHFSARVARAIVRRVESGESLRSICADPDLPHRSTVLIWRRVIPEFAAAVDQARRAAGWHMMGGRKPLWCEALASEVCARLAAGETLSRICDDPEMPSLSLVYRWRSERPEFEEQVQLALAVRAERICDAAWEVAQAITPRDAYATHVRLVHMRWAAAAAAPRRFGRLKVVEPPLDPVWDVEDEAPEVIRPYVKRFGKEVGPDGTVRVVELPPRPETLGM
jgi:hypothetical protein